MIIIIILVVAREVERAAVALWPRPFQPLPNGDVSKAGLRRMATWCYPELVPPSEVPRMNANHRTPCHSSDMHDDTCLVLTEYRLTEGTASRLWSIFWPVFSPLSSRPAFIGKMNHSVTLSDEQPSRVPPRILTLAAVTPCQQETRMRIKETACSRP